MEEKRNLFDGLRFILISCLFLVLFRILYSTPIEIDGDSVGKWASATSIAAGIAHWEDLDVSHHSFRWGVLMPQILVSSILPGRYESYFILPIIFYGVFTVAGMTLIRNSVKHSVLAVPILFGVLASVDPISHVSASQMKTVVFGLFYFILAAYLFLLYLKKGRMIWLVISAALVFLAYGSHITYLLFAAGLIIVMVGHHRDYVGAVIFCVTLGALLSFETLITGTVLAFEGFTSSRLEHLMTGVTHQPVTRARGSGAPLQYMDLLTRWRLLPKFDLAICVAYLYGTLMLFRKHVRREMPIAIWICYYSAGVYALAVSVPITSFDPLRLAMALHTRYLAPVFPLMMIFVVWLVDYHMALVRTWPKIVLPVLIGLTSLGFIYGSVAYRCAPEISNDSYTDLIEGTYCRIFRYTQNQNIYPAPDRFLLKAQEYYQDFSEDYRSGVVSLFGGTRIGVLSALIEFDSKEARFVETPNGWFSIDGSDKEFCVMELGQVDRPLDNYRSCGSQPMSRELFN